ncbi:Ras family protein [Tritrichomonas foetus]|uniref:Ras family protein n=1 Tax=Tritrichomonas foetus TaxID=1144522 RepID=A0A1J4JD95_9EUKA|nr:Ras family protein [Tritrichomonas foetus]|eukprot:OHS95651.1 Ras family protein [Tritrichomonas foetus]
MLASEENAPSFKVVFVGDSTVGKTSIIHRFLHLDEATTSTLGATSTRVDTSYNNTPLIMNVWDTAGQDNFRNLVPIYAKGSQAAVIVFDQSKIESFEHVKDWYDYLNAHVQNLRIVLAANKSDLQSEVDFNEVYNWAADHNIEMIKTSAKDGTNVEALFDTVAKQLYESLQETKKEAEAHKEDKREKVKEPRTVNVTESDKSEKKSKGGCCK